MEKHKKKKLAVGLVEVISNYVVVEGGLTKHPTTYSCGVVVVGRKGLWVKTKKKSRRRVGSDEKERGKKKEKRKQPRTQPKPHPTTTNTSSY